MDATSKADEDAEETYQEGDGLFMPMMQRQNKQNSILPIWGNKESMNLNHLVLENIVNSPYFKNKLSTLKTYHEIVDEIYYNVVHLEPWEKGTRKTTGQTGMCGGVRGVGAGGVVSTAFCILFKLFAMKLTRKQLIGLLNHTDSPYIRGLGFMYIRFCQPPDTFWEWYESYFEDEEEIDPKAGGGDKMTIGQLVKLFLTKLDWYTTLFPRIPVPIHKDLEQKLRQYNLKKLEEEKKNNYYEEQQVETQADNERAVAKASRRSRSRSRSIRRDRERDQIGRRSRSPLTSSRRHSRNRSPRRRSRSKSRDRIRKRSRSRSRSKDLARRRSRDRDRDRDRDRKHKHKRKHRHHHSKSHRHKKHSKSKGSSRSPSVDSPKREKSSRNQSPKLPVDKARSNRDRSSPSSRDPPPRRKPDETEEGELLDDSEKINGD